MKVTTMFLIFIGSIALLNIGKIAYEFGADYFKQEEAPDPEYIIPDYIISNPPEIEEYYGLSWTIKDDRPDKTEPINLCEGINAKHCADIRIQIDDQVRELTFTEFKDLIFGEERGKPNQFPELNIQKKSTRMPRALKPAWKSYFRR